MKNIISSSHLMLKMLTAMCLIISTHLYSQDYSRNQILFLANTYFEVGARTQQGETVPSITLDTLYLENKAKMFLCQDGTNWVVFANEQSVNPIVCHGDGSFTLKELQESPLWFLLTESMIGLDSLRISRDSQDSAHIDCEMPTRSRSYPTPLLDLTDPFLGNGWKQSGNNSCSAGCDTNRIYNKYCPAFYNVSHGRTVAGCTAVAMGQVMWYYHWPAYAAIPAHIYASGVTYGGFVPRIYNWNLMPICIFPDTPPAQAKAIASLLRDCGYAGNMIYGATGSSMTLTNAKNALENTFQYSTKMRHYSSGATLFTNTIKSEIAASRPVIIQATHATSGKPHTFVIDGYYSTTEEFHINMGWGTGAWYSVSGANAYNYYTIARRMLYEIIPDNSKTSSMNAETGISAKRENNLITVTASNENPIYWSIYDIYGNMMTSGTGSQADISCLPQGTYTFVANAASATCQIKFMK